VSSLILLAENRGTGVSRRPDDHSSRWYGWQRSCCRPVAWPRGRPSVEEPTWHSPRSAGRTCASDRRRVAGAAGQADGDGEPGERPQPDPATGARQTRAWTRRVPRTRPPARAGNGNGRPEAAAAWNRVRRRSAGGLLGLGFGLGLGDGGQVFLDAGGLAFQAT